MAPQPHPAPPSRLLSESGTQTDNSRILSESGTQTDNDVSIQSQSRRITDFGVGALGVHPQAPIITWDRVSKSESSPTPARVALPLVIHDERNILQDVSFRYLFSSTGADDHE